MNRFIKSYTVFVFAFVVPFLLKAQIKDSTQNVPLIQLSGYVDVFYVFDFNMPTTNYRQSFSYNYNRHNEFNTNLSFIKASALHKKYRANIALQTGTYTSDNYANETDVLKNIFEANAGISLNKKNTLWVDAGIFASHIGFESAVAFDNATLTRSLLAENSPYYLAGAKLNYSPNNKLEVNILVCNGWQRIQKIQGNSLPSFGTQLKLKPNANTTFNWSTFIGTDYPDSTRRMRYFNNLYGVFQISKKLSITAGFDYGVQQSQKNSGSYNTWFSPIIISQFTIKPFLKTAIRAEYYSDINGIIIATKSINGFNTYGLSGNIDYLPTENTILRFEARWLHSKDDLFTTNNSTSNHNFIIATSLSVRFTK